MILSQPSWSRRGKLRQVTPALRISGLSADDQAAKELGHPMIQASLRIVVPEGKREEILDVLSCLKGPTEVSRECRACRIFQDAENKNVLTYLVTWETQEDLEKHLRSERFRRLLPYIEMSREPPEVDFSTINQVRGIEFMIALLSSQTP